MISDIIVFEKYIAANCDGTLLIIPKVYYDKSLMTIIHCNKSTLISDFQAKEISLK